MYKQRLKFAVTVDVEDSYPEAVKGVDDFLKIFFKNKIKATFFITCEVLEKYPRMVSQIHREGHEIASHGLTHFKATEKRLPQSSYLLNCSIDEAALEIERSFKIFKNHGYEVIGFRAPSFGMNGKILSLVDKYFAYDSSYIEGKYKPLSKLNIEEFPVSRLRWLNIPLGTPYLLKLNSLNKKWWSLLPKKDLLVFYGHCFDFVTPNLKMLKKNIVKKWWYHRECGLSAEKFYDSLLKTVKKKGFRFVTLRECLHN